MTKHKFKVLPKHIAFIVDGNGRWAKKRHLKRFYGHKAGIETLKNIINTSFDIGINVISVYAFSTENWNRPKDEVNYLFQLFRDFLQTDYYKELQNSVKLNIMGDYSKFPDDLVKEIENSLNLSKDNKSDKILNLGLNYGGQDEILRAVNAVIKDKADFVDKDRFEKYLYTSELPPLDFIVRTSGEQRLSNFMLWQSAYSELYFPKTYWPDFNERKLIKSLKIYEKRNRRFGSIKENE